MTAPAMDPTRAMQSLDRLVSDSREDDRYVVAKALYEAALAGLLRVPLSPVLLSGWVIKWATLPDARGTREVDPPPRSPAAREGNVIGLMAWLEASVDRANDEKRLPMDDCARRPRP